MATTDEQKFAIAKGNRLLAADMFEGLTDEQWLTPSLCGGWTVREVLAHLVPLDGFKPWQLVVPLIRARGSLDRLVDTIAREDAKQPTDVLVRQLREHAGAQLKVPIVGISGPMSDTAIHLRDAARPLGLDVSPEPASWLPVLDFLVTRAARAGFVAKGRLDGLRLVATDQDWAHGAGDEVSGTSEALAVAMGGRAVVLPELTGPGVAMFTSRQ